MPDMKYASPMKRWDVLVQTMNANNYRTFVEVGCKEGRLTGAILKGVSGAHVVAIDPWRAMPQQQGIGETYEEWDFEKIEAEFWKNVEGRTLRLEMRRQTSLEAAAHYAELMATKSLQKEFRRGFDLVFIDAAHDHDNVLADIRAWWPLVRDGGMLAGHDYQHKFPGTMRAVAEAFPLINVGVMPDSVWCVPKLESMEIRI